MHHKKIIFLRKKIKQKGGFGHANTKKKSGKMVLNENEKVPVRDAREIYINVLPSQPAPVVPVEYEYRSAEGWGWGAIFIFVFVFIIILLILAAGCWNWNRCRPPPPPPP